MTDSISVPQDYAQEQERKRQLDMAQGASANFSVQQPAVQPTPVRYEQPVAQPVQQPQSQPEPYGMSRDAQPYEPQADVQAPAPVQPDPQQDAMAVWRMNLLKNNVGYLTSALEQERGQGAAEQAMLNIYDERRADDPEYKGAMISVANIARSLDDPRYMDPGDEQAQLALRAVETAVYTETGRRGLLKGYGEGEEFASKEEQDAFIARLDAANAPRWAPGLGLYRNKKELEEKESFRKYREKQTQDLLNMLDFLDRQVAGRGLSFDYGFGKTDDLFYERDEKALDDPSKGVLGASINRLRDVIGRGGAAMDLTDTRKQQAFDQVYDAVKERYEKEAGARSPFTVFNDAVAKGWIQQGLTWVSGDTDEKAETLRIAQEMASVRNPRRVEGISDIRGVGSFGVFMLESFAEMIPQIAEQAASMYVGGKLIGAGLKALAGGEKAMLAMTPAKLDALSKVSERAMKAYQFGSTMRLNLADVSQQIRDEANERGLSVDDVSDFDRWALAGVYSAIDLALDPTLGMMRRAFNPMRRNLSKSIRQQIADHVISDKGTLYTALNVLRSAVKSGASEALGEGPFQGGASRIYTALRFGTPGMASSGEVTPEGTTDWGKLIENMADEGLAASSAAIFPALGERTRAAFRQKRNDRFNVALLKTRAVEKFVHGLEQADRDGVIDGMGSLDRRLLAQAVLDSAKMFDTRTRMSVADDASRALLEKELAAHRQNMADVYNYGTKAVKDYVDGLRSVFVERDFDSIPADIPDTHAPDNDIRIARREAVEAMQKAMATKGAKLPLIYGEAPIEGQTHRIRYTETEFAPGKFSISVRDEVDGRKPEDAQDTFVVGEDGTADEVRAKALAYGHQLARFHEALRRDDVPRANFANAVLERAGKKGQRVFFVSTKEELMSKGFKEDAKDDGGRSLYGPGNALSNAWSAFTTPDGRIFIRREAVKTYGELMAALFHETFHRDFGSAVAKVSKDEAAMRELGLSGLEVPDEILSQLVRGALLGIRLAKPFSKTTADEWRKFEQDVTDAEERLAYKSEYLTGGVDKGRPVSVLEHPFRAVFYSRAKKAFPRLNALLKSYLAAMSGVEVTDQMVADFVGAMQENADGGENFITNVADGSFGTAEDRTVQQLWDLLDGDPDVDATGSVFAGQGERQQAQRDEEDAANTVEQPVADVEEVAPYAAPETPAPEPTPQSSNADRTKQRQKEIDAESARRVNDEKAADKKEEARRKEATSESRRIASDIKKADKADELQRKEESDEAKRIVSDIKKADERDYAKQKAAAVDDSTAVPAAVRKVVRNAKTTVQSNTDRMNEIEDAKKAGKSSSVTRSKRIKKFWSGEDGADGVAKTLSPVEDLAYDFGVAIDKYNADLALSRDKSKKQDVRDAAGRRLSKLRARVSQLIGADLSGKLFRGETLTDADGDAILAMWNEKTKGAPSVRRTADKREYVKKDKVPAANQSQNGSHRTVKTREEVLKMNEDKSPVEQSLLDAIERGGLAPMQLLQDAVDFSKQLRANESQRGVRAEDNKVKARTLRNVAESPEGVAAVIEMLRRVVSELKPGQAKEGSENARSLLKAYEQKWRDMVGVSYDKAEVRVALPDHTDAIMNLPIGSAEVEEARNRSVMDPTRLHAIREVTNRETGQKVEIRGEDEEQAGEESIADGLVRAEENIRGYSFEEGQGDSADNLVEPDDSAFGTTERESGYDQDAEVGEEVVGTPEIADDAAEFDEDVGLGEARVDAATQKRLADADGDVDKIVKIVNDKATPVQSLAKIATEHKNPAVRLASIEPLGARSAIHVAGQALFVLEADPDPDVSEAASKKISDLDLDPENFGMFASGESIARAMRDAGHPELWNGLQKAKALLRRKRRDWGDLSHDEKVEIKKASDGWEFVDGHWVNDGDPVHFNPKSLFAKDVLALSGRMFAAREAVKNAVFDKLQEQRRDVLTKLEMIRAANRHAIGALARFCGLRHPDVAEFTYLEDEFPELREETQNIIMENGGEELRSLYNDFVSAGYREDNMLPDVLAGNEIDAAIEADPTLEVARIEFSPIIDNSIAVYGQRDENNTMTLSLSALIQGPEAVANTLVHEFGHIQEDLESWAPGGSEESVGKQALSRLGIDSYTAYYRLSGEVMSRALEARRRLTHEERLGSLLQDTMDLDVKAEDRLNLLEMREDKDGSFLLQMSRPMFASATDADIAEAQRQYDEVVAKYRGTPQWLKAPNGKDTNLTERQWVQVRTPAFKAWFGDWETLSTRLFLDGDPVSSVDGTEYMKVRYDELEDAVVGHFASLGISHSDNAEIGRVRITRTGIHDSLAKGAGRMKIAAFNAIPDIISKGRVVSREANWKERGYDTATIAAPISIGGKVHVALVVVRQYGNNDNNFYLHEVGLLEDLKKETERFYDSGLSPDGGKVARPLGSLRTLAKSLFKVKPENVSKVVDENGEPLVVAHSTDAEFTVFRDMQKNDAGWLGAGFYFFGDRSLDGQYGRNVMECFLNVRKPYFISDEERDRLAESDDADASTEFSEEIRGEGYDGVYYNGDLNREWAVFSPSQIKSATDNVGTFSGANPDIRFASTTSADTARSLFSRFGLDPVKFGLRPNADGTVDYDMTMDALLRRLQTYFGDMTFDFGHVRRSLQEVTNLARSMIVERPKDVDELIKRMLEAAEKKEHPPVGEVELAVLYLNEVAAEERFRAAFEAYAQAGELSDEERARRSREYTEADAALVEAATALSTAKSSTGAALNANKMMLRSDYTYGGLVSRAIHEIRRNAGLRRAGKQGPLTEDERKQLRDMALKVAAAEKKLREAQEKIRELEGKKAAQAEIDAAVNNARKNGNERKKKDGKNDADHVETVDEAVEYAKKTLAARLDPSKGGAPVNLADWGQVNVAIQDLVRRIGKAIAADYGLKNAMRRMPFEQFEAELFRRCDPVFGALKASDGSRGGIVAREYVNLFSDYEQYNKTAPSYDPIANAVRELVSLSKRMEDLRRIKETGTGFDRYGYAKLTSVKDVDEEMQRVSRALAEADRASGVSNFIRKDPNAKATALDRMKKAMLEEIRSLEDHIKNKTPLPPSLREIVEDGDAKRIRELLAERRAEYDAMFGPAWEKWTDDERLDYVLKQLEKRLAADNRKLANLEKYRRTSSFRVGKDGGIHFIRDTKEIIEKKAEVRDVERKIRETRAIIDPETNKVLLAQRMLQVQLDRKQHYKDKCQRFEDAAKRKDGSDPRGRSELRAFLHDEEWMKAWNEANEERRKADELLGKFVYDRASWIGKRAMEWGSLVQVMRSYLASGDESGINIQCAWYAMQHPVKAVRAALLGLRSTWNKEVWDKMSKDFLENPRAQVILEQMGVKVPLSNWGYGGARSEEVFSRDWLAKNKFKVFGVNLGDNAWLRTSERMFAIPVMKFRIDMANAYLDFLEKMYGSINQIKKDELEYGGRVINAVTGAGDFFGHGDLKSAASLFFWAPGRISGQLQTLFLPATIWAHNEVGGKFRWKIASEHIIGAWAKLVGFYMMLAFAGQVFGGGDDDDGEPLVDFDPRSNRFAKIRVFGRYVSITGNLEQYPRLLWRGIVRAKVGSDGVVKKYGEGMYGEWKDDLWRTIQGKVRPEINTVFTLMNGGKDAIGRQVNMKRLGKPFNDNGLLNFFLMNGVRPLTVGEIYETCEANGIPRAIVPSVLAFVGITGSDYGQTPYTRARNRLRRLDASLKSDEVPNEVKLSLRRDAFNARLIAMKSSLGKLEKEAKDLRKNADSADSAKERRELVSKAEAVEKRYIDMVYGVR